MKIKELALKLFGFVYGVKTPTTYLVKKQFPKFRASLKDHWEFLILKLLKEYRKIKVEKQVEQLKDFCKMTDRQLREEAQKKGIDPNQPRFKLLRALGVKDKEPKFYENGGLIKSRGRFIKPSYSFGG